MRDLNQRTSEVVRRIAAERHAVEITSNGEPTGVQLVPVSRGPAVLDQLVAAGRATAPTVHGPITAPPPSAGDPVDVAAALAAERDEERW
ncbi:hypothetical protein GCM10023222_05560 [Saccharopolyspora cebuensis]